MNSGVSNTSTPILSQECIAPFSKFSQTCSAEMVGFANLGKSVPRELQDCAGRNSCNPKQNQEYLTLSCPAIKKYFDCMDPVKACALEAIPSDQRVAVSRLVNECNAFLESSSSANTTTSGNGAPTKTTSKGNGAPTNTPPKGNGAPNNTPNRGNASPTNTPAASAGFSLQGSLISIFSFSFALFL